MRYVFGILFVLFFAGFAACSFLLGGSPSQVFQLSDILFGGALLCAILSLISLTALSFGVGAKEGKISPWSVPLLGAFPLIASLGLGVLFFTAKSLGNTVEHLALDTKLKICAVAMIVFGLITLGVLPLSVIMGKKHNSKLQL